MLQQVTRAPPRVLASNWMREFAKWCPSLRCVRFHGSKEERASMVENVLCPGTRDDQRL